MEEEGERVEVKVDGENVYEGCKYKIPKVGVEVRMNLQLLSFYRTKTPTRSRSEKTQSRD